MADEVHGEVEVCGEHSVLVSSSVRAFFAKVLACKEAGLKDRPVDAVNRIASSSFKLRNPGDWGLSEQELSVLRGDGITEVVIL